MASKKRKESNDVIEDQPPSKKRKLEDESPDQDAAINLSTTSFSRDYYIPSSISLKTTDECVKDNLLANYSDSNMKAKLSLLKKHDKSKQVLIKVKNLLSKPECSTIIQKCESEPVSFQNLNASKKYTRSIRQSDRLLIVDEQLAQLLWQRLSKTLQSDIVNKHNISTVPLGFGVLNGIETNKWQLSSINNAMRINRYDSRKNDFFSYHKDAQYCPSADERSLFTLIIYLNDDFYGGYTNFYFAKQQMDVSNVGDLTTLEEIHHFRGTKNGFDCETVTPLVGDAIIFSHDIIHEGCKIETPKKCKYILKTDIMVQRGKSVGFAISTQESEDYQRCLQYFAQAQQNELGYDTEKAGELYERSLFIRYLYPRKLESNDKIVSRRKVFSDVKQIWLVIFDYCSIREMECISYLFPSLYTCLASWKMVYNHRHTIKNNNTVSKNRNCDAFYIPTFEKRFGGYYRFRWKDDEFFQKHIVDCCRVAAIYAFYLSSHQDDADYFIAEYDTHSQNVVAVPLWKLLRDVFYQRQCHGSYFKVRKQFDNILQDFDDKIDRKYMSIVHDSQFIGGCGMPEHFRRSIEVSGNSIDSEIFSCSGCDRKSMGLEELAQDICSNLYPKQNKLNYVRDLMKIRDTWFGWYKMKVKEHTEDDVEGEDWEHIGEEDFEQDLECNQLIFDFSKNKLDVTNDEMNDTCSKSCLSLNVIKEATSEWESLKYYKVNIEGLFSKENKYSMSFNHAGQGCAGHEGEILLDVDVCGYFGYEHLNHMHIATMTTKNKNVLMWVSYNHTAAL